MIDGRGGVEVASAVGKAVGCHIDDAHDARPIEGDTGNRWAWAFQACQEFGQPGIRIGPQLRRRDEAARRPGGIAGNDLGGAKQGGAAAGEPQGGKVAAGTGVGIGELRQGTNGECGCHVLVITPVLPRRLARSALGFA